MPNLWVGAWPDKNTLEREDFDVVVTCCYKKLPEGWEDFIIKHYHFPMSDSSQIPGKIPFEANAAVAVVTRAIFQEKKTLVHCYAGHNRSWLVATMAWAHLNAKSYSEAYAHSMETYDGALQNPAFKEFLNDGAHCWERPVWEASVGYADPRGDSEYSL